MDEAFTDMQAYMDFETDKEVCPFFSGLKENTIRGLLYVSSYGGRTANTEYEVLTGDSVGFVPPSSTPYQLYIDSPMPNLDAALENQGYRHTVGMHPYRPSGYNRENVYRLFGFDHLIFLDQFPDAELIYGKVSDDADVDRIITEYEAAKL
ncbi:MAG TPA: arylsulfatase, partial [Lachnospiraceae bacterium]|nr:arylsulfatase [Lachnospiraceae bacterium]